MTIFTFFPCLRDPRDLVDDSKRGFFDNLPDDVIIEILHRLPIDQILQIQAVCRWWHRLIATRNFAQVHLAKANSVYLFLRVEFDTPSDLYCRAKLYRGRKLSFVDWASNSKNRKKKLIRSMMLKVPAGDSEFDLVIYGGCDGLLIIGARTPRFIPATHFIYNPVTQERCILAGIESDSVWGFYFHSLTNEYRLLCVSSTASRTSHRYYMRNVTSSVQKEVGTFAYMPRLGQSIGLEDWIYCLPYCPLFANYHEGDHPCCEHLIMAFDVHTEQLEFMPHPGGPCRLGPRRHNTQMRLLSMDDKLGMCHDHKNDRATHIWVLEDRANWFWVKKFRIQWPRYVNILNPARVLSFKDGEFILIHKQSVLRYHPHSRRVSKVKQRDMFGHREILLLQSVFNCKLSLLSPRDLM